MNTKEKQKKKNKIEDEMILTKFVVKNHHKSFLAESPVGLTYLSLTSLIRLINSDFSMKSADSPQSLKIFFKSFTFNLAKSTALTSICFSTRDKKQHEYYDRFD